MKRINPELKEGDKIVLIHMDDKLNPLTPGTEGTVTRVINVMDIIQYDMKWNNGSTYNLLSDADKWILKSDYDRMKSKLNETSILKYL